VRRKVRVSTIPASGWDYLPPGSEQFEYEGYVYAGYKDSPAWWEKGTKPEPINWYAGKQYDDCFQAAYEVLQNFDENFPPWKGDRTSTTRIHEHASVA